MTDYEALMAAVSAEPEEDALRLALADWLEENEQAARAAFMRAQIELARTAPWEPFAAFCRWRRPDWVTGRAFRDTLPEVAGSGIEWHDEPFRRGLGWRIQVRNLIAWEQLGRSLAAASPIGEMRVWGGTLDDWKRFAKSPVIRQLRRLHFAASPIEPLRELRDQPAALGIADLFFDRSSGAGMPEVVEDLFGSPLGEVVRGLHFRMGGYESLDHLMLTIGQATRLERLAFANMGLNFVHIIRLASTPALGDLAALHLRSEHLGSDGVSALAAQLPTGLVDLMLADVEIASEGVLALARADRLTGLRRLDLSDNTLTPRAAKILSESHSLASLRSLRLGGCRMVDKCLRHLARAKFWPNLVELDLSGNPIGNGGVRYLLDALVPPDLAALVLNSARLGAESRAELRRKYGERLVLLEG